MSVIDTKMNAELKIKQFKADFLLEFDIEILVTMKHKKSKFPRIKLEDLESMINNMLHKQVSIKYPDGIRTHGREHDLINLRYCFYKIALDMKYTLTFVACYLGFHHASVLHGRKVITNLLITKDAISVFNINNIYYELKEKFGIDANIYSDEFTEYNTQPILPAFEHPGGNIS